jgi:hypothetical protein
LTNACSSSSGSGAGLVSWSDTQDGFITATSVPLHDHLSYLTGLVMTSKLS